MWVLQRSCSFSVIIEPVCSKLLQLLFWYLVVSKSVLWTLSTFWIFAVILQSDINCFIQLNKLYINNCNCCSSFVCKCSGCKLSCNRHIKCNMLHLIKYLQSLYLISQGQCLPLIQVWFAFYLNLPKFMVQAGQSTTLWSPQTIACMKQNLNSRCFIFR